VTVTRGVGVAVLFLEAKTNVFSWLEVKRIANQR